MEFPGLVQSNEQCYLAPAHGKILRHGSKINNLALQIQGPLSFRPEGEIFLLALLDTGVFCSTREDLRGFLTILLHLHQRWKPHRSKIRQTPVALLAGLASRKIPRSEDYARNDNGMSNL
jgi:hypothetical protein